MDKTTNSESLKYAKMYYLPELWKSIQHIPTNHYAKTRAEKNIEELSKDNIKFTQIDNTEPYEIHVIGSSISSTCYDGINTYHVVRSCEVTTYYIHGDIEEFKTRNTTYIEKERAIIEGISWTNEELIDVQTMFVSNESDELSFGTKVFLKYQKKIFDFLTSKDIILKYGDTINIFSIYDHRECRRCVETEQYLMYDKVDGVDTFFKMAYDNWDYPNIPKQFRVFSDRFHSSYFNKLPFYHNYDYHVDPDFLKCLSEEMFEEGTYKSEHNPNRQSTWTSEGPVKMYDWKIKYTKEEFFYKGKTYHILIPGAKLVKDIAKARVINQEYFTSSNLGESVEYNLKNEYFLTDFKKKYLNSKKITSEMSNEDLVKLVNGDIIILS